MLDDVSAVPREPLRSLQPVAASVFRRRSLCKNRVRPA
jgi:hypothetical protein